MCGKICQNHLCGARFLPRSAATRATQLYCSTECKMQHRNWKSRRGETIVPVLLLQTQCRRMSADQRAAKLAEMRAEFGAFPPGLVDGEIPTLAHVERIVRAWRAEMNGD